MKLRLISEIQYKYCTTSMDRLNTTGQLGSASLNDLFHHIYGRKSHLVNSNNIKDKSNKTNLT